MNLPAFEATLNDWGRVRKPFVFAVDFEMEEPMAWPLDEVDGSIVFFDFNGVSNKPRPSVWEPVRIEAMPVGFTDYSDRFDIVMNGLLCGDTFLANLTISTPINVNKSLEELFFLSEAKYKFMVKDRFLVFSPETFVRLTEGMISTFPMKGTISAEVPGAHSIILLDSKEKAEHVTIVDLLRNDISIVANNVSVKRFRYIEKLTTNRNSLLQVSSEIEGRILPEYSNRIGTILVKLLPAGSVSGAPKNSTLKIISSAEKQKRGFYTGVCGYFDGKTFDCGVMIRFIEQRGSEYFFRSGGGITTQSVATIEYQEALDKIYVPLL